MRLIVAVLLLSVVLVDALVFDVREALGQACVPMDSCPREDHFSNHQMGTVCSKPIPSPSASFFHAPSTISGDGAGPFVRVAVHANSDGSSCRHVFRHVILTTLRSTVIVV